MAYIANLLGHSPEILFESLRGTEMVNSIYIYIEKYNLQFYSPMYTFILYIYIYIYITFINCIKFQSIMSIA